MSASEDAVRMRIATELDVSRETMAALDTYAARLLHWTQAINLVSKHDRDRLWSRHIADSLGLAPWLPSSGVWMDVGSGGGLPVLPLAIVSRETRPDLEFVAVESDQRKATFLREAAHAVNVSMRVRSERIETIEPGRASVLSMRAFDNVAGCVAKTAGFLRSGASLYLLKGDRVFGELTEAALKWHIRFVIEPNKLTRNGNVLIIREASRAENS
ncbi:MAG: 16S rRNA (guanine(527)-N(7))-methyltransferase RsmG [Pseudomonadota bacterium]